MQLQLCLIMNVAECDHMYMWMYAQTQHAVVADISELLHVMSNNKGWTRGGKCTAEYGTPRWADQIIWALDAHDGMQCLDRSGSFGHICGI